MSWLCWSEPSILPLPASVPVPSPVPVPGPAGAVAAAPVPSGFVPMETPGPLIVLMGTPIEGDAPVALRTATAMSGAPGGVTNGARHERRPREGADGALGRADDGTR